MKKMAISLDHYSENERIFAKQVSNWLHESLNAPFLTVFLNPRQQEILSEMAAQAHISVIFDGGYAQAENKRAIISLEDERKADFKIALLQIDYPAKYFQLHHSTILGSLIHQGIAYERLGDVIFEKENWQLLVDSTLAAFIVQNVTRAGAKKIAFRQIDAAQMLDPQSDEQEKEIIVSSQRIDLLISQNYHFSRAHARDLIESGAIMINWFENDNASYLAKIGDVISTHGYGRIRLIETRGTTNRNKIRLKIGFFGKN
ncbi:RNA-binding protein [Oenococcus sicerae]|uniref:YlmH family RNA-binding protein n=2 Tax=Oenococcus sicerae TaxID=2203724 RepID=UPI0010B35C32|nr:hypothetical protein OAL24_01242 [Oenococcus sicerae]